MREKEKGNSKNTQSRLSKSPANKGSAVCSTNGKKLSWNKRLSAIQRTLSNAEAEVILTQLQVKKKIASTKIFQLEKK